MPDSFAVTRKRSSDCRSNLTSPSLTSSNVFSSVATNASKQTRSRGIHGVVNRIRQGVQGGNLRNRSYVKELDFTPQSWVPSPTVAEPEGREVLGQRATSSRREEHRPDLREDVDANQVRVRGRRARPGRATSPTSTRPAPRSATRRRSRTPPGCSAERTTGSSTAGSTRRSSKSLAGYAGVPVWNGLTDEFHPTQILADVLTMTEHSDKHVERDRILLPGRRPQQHGQLADGGGLQARDGRTAVRPRAAVAREELVESCRAIADETGARITLTDDVDEGVDGVDFLYTDVWVSMGEARRLERADRAPQAVPGQRRDDAPRPATRSKFMHCLPAFHNRETKVGQEIFEEFGIDELEVTDEVFESPARSSSTRPRTGCTRSRPSWSRRSALRAPMRIVVALGGNALLRRGQPMTAENQRERAFAARALAPIAEGNELVVSHGNGPQVGLLALQAAAYQDVEAYPLDVLGAQTEGMIGYMIEQELGNLLPFDRPFATDPDDGRGRPRRPGVRRPDQVHRAGLRQGGGRRARGREGLGRSSRTATSGGVSCRRLSRSGSSRSGRSVAARAGRRRDLCRRRRDPHDVRAGAASVGVEAVIDKDLASALLAEELDADLFVMATDVDGVYADWGTPEQRAIDRVTPASCATWSPRRVDGSRRSRPPSVRRTTGKRAAIGAWRTSPRSSLARPVHRWCLSDRRTGDEDDRARCPIRSGQAAQGDGPPARA